MTPHDPPPPGPEHPGDGPPPSAGLHSEVDLAWIDGFEDELRDRMEQSPVPESRPTLLDRLFARRRDT